MPQTCIRQNRLVQPRGPEDEATTEEDKDEHEDEGAAKENEDDPKGGGDEESAGELNRRRLRDLPTFRNAREKVKLAAGNRAE